MAVVDSVGEMVWAGGAGEEEGGGGQMIGT